MPQRTINLHLVSDSTGETLNSIARATLARFDDPHVIRVFDRGELATGLGAGRLPAMSAGLAAVGWAWVNGVSWRCRMTMRASPAPGYVSGTPGRTSRESGGKSARTVSEMLAQAMENGKSSALVEGYRIAGKTGTAQIPGPDGFYDPKLTNASFIGWGPVDDPQFMVYVWLEKPNTSEWASYVAAPVFNQVVEKLVVLLDIPPDQVRRQLTAGQ